MQSPIKLLLVLLGCCLSAISARASHFLGADITYEYAGTATLPYQYRVTVRGYQDLQSAATTVSIPLNATRDGCSTATPGSFTLTLVSSPATPGRVLSCTAFSGYRVHIFQALIQLPPGRWTLSCGSETRGMMTNLTDMFPTYYAEAFLDNSTNLQNNSPQFTSFTLPYLTVNQLHRYSFSAFDLDGDSLVYRPVQPLKSTAPAYECGAPIGYTSYPAGNLQDPATGQSVGYDARSFSPALPLFSFLVTNGVATPYFQLNPATGDLLTQPISNVVGKYGVAVRVEEYRRLGATWTLIGSVRRDVTYSVFTNNPGGNRNPAITSLRLGTQPQPLDQPIRVAPGQTATLLLTATDADAAQQVRISSDVAEVLPGASFQSVAASGSSAQGQLVWQVPATLPPGRYSCSVTVADNSCPNNGNAVHTLNFLVTNQVLATPARQRRASLTAYPTPFHDRVQFQLPAAGRQAVQITDSRGRLVAELISQPDGRVTWQPAATLAPGLYLARPADGTTVIRLLHQ